MSKIKEICFPSHIKDMFIIILFPPLWVFLKEFYSPTPFKNFFRIVMCFLLTSCFYFPGMMYALNILRYEGGI